MVAVALPDDDIMTSGEAPAIVFEPDPWTEPGPADAPIVPLFDDDGVLIPLGRLEDDEPA